MQRYRITGEIGSGTYGTVSKATDQRGGIVAIKRLKRKFDEWSECVTIREIESLRFISSHENIVAVKELIRENDSQLYFVFEYCPDGNLYELMKGIIHSPRCKSKWTADKVSAIIKQVLRGLEHIHNHGYFHRDIKPENLLMSGNTCKIADFGLCRRHRCNYNTPPLTEYVSTRWYRAPEVLLRSPDYAAPIDIFAVGCIMVELLVLKPLFPGKGDLDQIHRIFDVLGVPTEKNWPNGRQLMQKLDLHFPSDESLYMTKSSSPKHAPFHLIKIRRYFEQLLPTADPVTVSFAQNLLRLDPSQRPTATRALTNNYFQLTLKNQLQNVTYLHTSPTVQYPSHHIRSCTRFKTPVLEMEGSPKKKKSQNSITSASLQRSAIQDKSFITRTISQQHHPTLQLGKNIHSSSLLYFENISSLTSRIAKDDFTNNQFNNILQQQTTPIKSTEIENLPQERQMWQGKKFSELLTANNSGFGRSKFRHYM